MPNYFKSYTAVYFLACFASLFFIDIGYSLTEMSVKLLALLALLFLYLRATKNVNYWYLFILLNSIASDAFLIFEDSFLLIGSLLILLNRILYIMISRRALFNTKKRTLLFYGLPFVSIFFLFFLVMKPYLGEILVTFFFLGLSSVIMILFAFLNFLNKMNTQNKYFLTGILLIFLADVLMVYNQFLDYNIWYVVFYTSVYYVARYLICRAMILEKR